MLPEAWLIAEVTLLMESLLVVICVGPEEGAELVARATTMQPTTATFTIEEGERGDIMAVVEGCERGSRGVDGGPSGTFRGCTAESEVVTEGEN
jgi:hypothetical protein